MGKQRNKLPYSEGENRDDLPGWHDSQQISRTSVKKGAALTDDFKPLYELLNAKHTVAELAERIELGDLKWIDDYGRIVNAIAENQQEALQCLAKHYSMDQGIPPEYAGEEAYNYWGDWESLGGPWGCNSPLVRAGFISGIII